MPSGGSNGGTLWQIEQIISFNLLVLLAYKLQLIKASGQLRMTHKENCCPGEDLICTVA